MGLSKKRKQNLAQITARAAECKKQQKIDQENQQKRRFLRKQREEEDYWDEHKDFRSESSSNKSNFVELSLDGCSFDKENQDGEENRKGHSTQKGLRDDKRGV